MIGKIIYELRTSQKLEQRTLCRGICAVSSLSRYESGERQPDRMKVNVFLQRLGKSPDKFAMMVPAREYAYLNWCKDLIEQVELEHWTRVREQLSQEPDRRKGDHLRNQFHLYIQAILADHQEHDKEKSVKLLGEAIQATVPDYETIDIFTLRQSMAELNLRILQVQLYYEWQKERKSLSQERLLAMQNYMEDIIRFVQQNYSDEEEKVKIYPNAVVVGMNLFQEMEAYEQAIFYGKKALRMMQENHVIKGRKLLLEKLVVCLEKKGEEQEKEKIRFQLEKLYLLEKEYMGAERRKADRICFPQTGQEIYLAGEVFELIRKSQKFTQEELAGSEHARTTISRLENGWNYSKNMYHDLKVKMGVWTGDCESEIFVDSFQQLEIKAGITKCMKTRKYPQAQKMLEYLAQKLNLQIPQNRQFVRMTQVELSYRQNRITAWQAVQESAGALRDTIPSLSWKHPETIWEKTLYTRELSLMNSMAVYLRADGRYEQAIWILTHILKYMEEGKVDTSFHHDTKEQVLLNLAICQKQKGQYQEALATTKIAIKFCLKCGYCKNLSQLLENKEAVERQALTFKKLDDKLNGTEQRQ